MSIPTFFANRASISSGPLMMRLTFIDSPHPEVEGEARTEVLMVRADAVAMANAVLNVESQMSLAQQPVVGGQQ